MTWYNNNWHYRKSITISNPGSLLSDYQVLVTVDTANLISSSKLLSNCDDIRFTDNDGSTLLNYWIESGCNTVSTKIWVKIPSIPTSTKIIHVYYGNSGAITTSNYTDIFSYATGGNITTSDNYIIHTFLTNETFTSYFTGNVEALVIAGGGGGAAGGGGAGGLLYNASIGIVPQSYPVIVGEGGSGSITTVIGGNGQSSSFSTLLATGGGGGGRSGQTNYGYSGANGGSGGGAGGTSHTYNNGLPCNGTPGGMGISGQGNDGGCAHLIAIYAPYPNAGGGGAGSVGGNIYNAIPGNGGSGKMYNISGSEVYYAGGGGGGIRNGVTFATGGIGGGGNAGAPGTNGNINSGSGGGGTNEISTGGNGGSGIVIIRYTREIASPEPTISIMDTEEMSPTNITATSMTINSSNPCIAGTCVVTVDITWTNTGGISESFTPSIKIDNVTVIVDPPLSIITLGPSETMLTPQQFIITGLTAGTYDICPDPN